MATKAGDDEGTKVALVPEMYYRILGNTGLQVSVMSFGFWATFGVKDSLTAASGVEMAKRCMSLARDAGVNLFDNAETYGDPKGEAERIMGEAMAQLRIEDPVKWRRSDVLITTKIFFGGDGRNENGLSKKHIMEGVDAACKRLQIDYVDLVFCHRPDALTPTETIVRAMTDLVRVGKATAWGTSEWSAQQITEAFWIAKLGGFEPPQFEQPQYNMFTRERVEVEYFPLYRGQYNIGTTIWGPLANGLLTGKYNDDIPADSRLAQKGYEWLTKLLVKWRADGKIDIMKRIAAYAQKELQCSITQLALAWCVKNPNVTTVLLGATNTDQLEENLGAIEVASRLTELQMETIADMLGNTPEAYSGYGGKPGAFRQLKTI